MRAATSSVGLNRSSSGTEVDRIPRAVAAQQSPEEGGHRHGRASGDTALEAGGDGMNVLRQSQTVTGHAEPQMLHGSRYSHHWLGASRFDQGLVDMPATW
jgi:hypothetical protein